MNRLILATTNPGKVIEIQSSLGDIPGWSVEQLPPEVPTIEETRATFLDNAIQKAEHYSKHVDALTLSDDSGLCVAALGGRPGVHSARYADTRAERMARVLREMELVPDGDRDAAFYCALVLARCGTVIWTVEREARGSIVRTPSGMGGFGYDPIFWLPEKQCTMGELNTDEKNRWSARGRALTEFRKFLASM